MRDLISCQVCKGKEFDLISINISHGNIYNCKSCHLKFVHPLPSEAALKAAYHGLYSGREKLDEIDILKLRNTRIAFAGYFKRIKFTKGKTFLDIGGGLGYYSEAAQYFGFKSTLLDLDLQSLQFAKKALKIKNIFHGSIEDFGKQGQTFDIVFLRHIIEHIPDPNNLIYNARMCLKHDGLLIIETPNNRSLEIVFRPRILLSTIRNHQSKYKLDSKWKYIRKSIYAIRPPIHLYTYSNNNLRQLLINNGLTPVITLNYMIGHTTYWPNEKKSDINLIFKGIKNRDFKSILFGLADLVLYPIRTVFQITGNSSGICIYAKNDIY